MNFFIAITVLAPLCCTTLASTPTRYIDYDACVWKYGSPPSKINCDSGYIGTGACGNNRNARCNNHAFGIQCCMMRSSTITGPCYERYGDTGDDVGCDQGTFVYGTCGSLDMSSCFHNGLRKCITINCCPVDLQVNYGLCQWRYAPFQGEHLSCNGNAGSEQVMTGRCGSEIMGECGGDAAHGIHCCNLAYQ